MHYIAYFSPRCQLGYSILPALLSRIGIIMQLHNGNDKAVITFDREPSRYRHWHLTVDGRIATLALDVAEDAPIVPGYVLKLNSYDLGVDIELNDALQRIRFEHPGVGCVVVTSARERMFCA